MSYRYDSYLVISNKFSKASSDAKAQLFETYDRLRDLTVSGSSVDGAGFGTAGGFLWKLAQMIAPASFMTVMGGDTTMSIPGTSYWSSVNGGTTTWNGSTSAFGVNSLGNYSGFPSGAAPIQWGFGSDDFITGGASNISLANDIAGMTGLSTLAYGVGTSTGMGFGNNWVLPSAGVISGIGGVLQAAAPYMDAFGLPATVAGNLLQGTSSAALSAYQNVTGNITSNADVILSNKVKNIETIVNMLDAQSDVVKKMLKSSVEGDKETINNIS